MHLLTNTKPIPTGNLFGHIMPGTWLMHDRTAFELGVIAERGTVTRIEKFDHTSISGLGKRVMIMRSGAFGDLLLASPAIQVFKGLNQGIHLTLCCINSRAQLFDNTNLFDNIVDYPLPASEITNYDQIITLEDVIETSEKHATDAFADALNVSVINYRPSFRLTIDEIRYAKRHFNGERKKVAIQLRAGVLNRDYPAHLWQPVLLGLEDAGWEIMLLGVRNQIPPLPEPLRRPQRDLHHRPRAGGHPLRPAPAHLREMGAQDHVRVRAQFGAPHAVGQLLARHHRLGPLHQLLEQAELGGRGLHPLAAHLELHGAAVDRAGAAGVRRGLAILPAIACSGRRYVTRSRARCIQC